MVARRLSDIDGTARGKVRCRCGDNNGDGTFEVVGANLILTSQFGVVKVIVGLGPPRRLAKRLLKNLCTRAAAQSAGATRPERDLRAPAAPGAVQPRA